MITSLQNSLVKQWRRLGQKRHRDRDGVFLIEGEKELANALVSGIRLETLIVCPDLAGEYSLDYSGRVEEVSKEVFAKLAYRESVGGLLGVASYPDRRLDSLKLSDTPLVLILVGFEKPGNVGAVLRTADGANVDAVILCDSGVDLYNPNVIRASLGSIFTVPVLSAGSNDALGWLEANSFHVFTATPQTDQLYHTADFCQPTAMVIGSEHHGLPDQWLATGTQVKIPMEGQMDSLNASCSAAILTYEALRQRRV